MTDSPARGVPTATKWEQAYIVQLYEIMVEIVQRFRDLSLDQCLHRLNIDLPCCRCDGVANDQSNMATYPNTSPLSHWMRSYLRRRSKLISDMALLCFEQWYCHTMCSFSLPKDDQVSSERISTYTDKDISGLKTSIWPQMSLFPRSFDDIFLRSIYMSRLRRAHTLWALVRQALIYQVSSKTKLLPKCLFWPKLVIGALNGFREDLS